MEERKETQILVLERFVKRHLSPGSWGKNRKMDYYPFELYELLESVQLLLRKEESLVEINPPCLVVGDIHGQFDDLGRILNFQCDPTKPILAPFSEYTYVFLGDYVDRGNRSIECISLLFALKCLYPNNYILLRGNHETRSINKTFGFQQDFLKRFGKDDGIVLWEMFNEVFNWLPFACLVGQKMLCIHGGIRPNLNSLDEIREIERPLSDVEANKLAYDLIWADTMDLETVHVITDRPSYKENCIRGVSYSFNEAAVKEVAERLNIDLIVRSHKMVNSGFRFFAKHRLITIFSAPNYMNRNNTGAFLKVESSGKIGIIAMERAAPQTVVKDSKHHSLKEVPKTKTPKKTENGK